MPGEERSGRRPPEEIKKMFDSIAERYDEVNDLISLGATTWWRVRSLKAVEFPRGARVLDVGTGTGWIPRYLLSRRPDLEVTGVDVSEGMLAVARKRCPAARFETADAAALPFADGSFDVVTSAFVLRNVADREGSLREMVRVTAPGGTIMALDTFAPRRGNAWRAPMKIWLEKVMPFLASLRSRRDAYAYLADSILAFEERDKVREALASSGCEVKVLDLGFDTALCFKAKKRTKNVP